MCRIQWSPTKKKRELEKSALSFQTDRSNIYEIKKWQEKEYNQRKSVEIHEKNNQWKKSVWIREICGTKIINEKNLRHLRNLRDKLIFSEKKKTAEKKKIRGKKKTRKPQKSFEIWGSSLKGGGDLLSRIVLQYHRRKWA